MILYRTAAKEASAQIVTEKSKFIGHIKSVDSKEEADAFINSVREEYKDATHNVPCFIIGEKQELKWASDDGEPSGTSGMPMVQMLEKEGLTNIVLVVTRYYGGTKLGTGGLVRAYTETAAKTLEAAGIKEVREMTFIKYRMGYSALPKLQNMEKNMEFTIEDVVYEDTVTVDLSTEKEKSEQLKSALGDLTGGTGEIVKEVQKNT